jgi:hypothetical protein
MLLVCKVISRDSPSKFITAFGLEFLIASIGALKMAEEFSA